MADPFEQTDFSLSDMEFWEKPLPERAEAFARLRALPEPAFFAEASYGLIPPGPGYYAFVRHADVAAASRNSSVFASTPSAISREDLPAEFNEYFGSMINMDDPQHANIRRIVSRAFAPRVLERIRHQVEKACRKIVDDLQDTGPCDFVSTVAAPLPLRAICDMLGVPEQDRPTVLELTSTIVGGLDPELLGEDAEEKAKRLLAAGKAMHDLAADLAAARRRFPADDLTSALVNANVDGEALTDQQLGAFFTLLAIAGNETTRNALSHALLLLTDNPAQRDLLCSDLDLHLPGAAEEVVRLATPVTWMRRTLASDYRMGEREYRRGDKVLLFYWAANRDERVFDEPERFDITRRPNHHVGYGGAGAHFCLGAQLARTEITLLMRELLSRVPDIHADGEPDRLRSSFLNGVKRLPCSFG
ncbi:cytochrome P450 [Amycolatopsis sp. NPDC059090]|uniref:cytochrome P450 n=1 Tax=unclassified Amycolatopsis TaxID=2618356 RepID=UPI00366AD9B5